MDKIKKNFGFGCMRFPMIGEEIDEAQDSQMVDYFLDQGFNYFDTAHGYIGERSELAVKNCLTSRYPRESYILTNKLTAAYFEKEEDIRPFFESQLERCGVDYFDFYLMHAQGMGNYPKFKECHAYELLIAAGIYFFFRDGRRYWWQMGRQNGWPTPYRRYVYLNPGFILYMIIFGIEMISYIL